MEHNGTVIGLRALVALISPLLLLGMVGCSDAPEPGDLGAYCALLERGNGLSADATALDYQQLEIVAPPEIRDTIVTLATRAGDFDVLLAAEPPDLEAIFRARFDPAADQERAALDRHAETACGIQVERPPSTRWSNFVREEYPGAAWRDAVAMSFETESDQIFAATAAFAQRPEQMEMAEEVCRAGAEFLLAEGADDAIVTIVIGSVVWMEHPAATADCRVP